MFASLVEGLVGFPIDLNARRTFTRGWEMMPLHRIVFRRSCADLVRGYLEVIERLIRSYSKGYLEVNSIFTRLWENCLVKKELISFFLK